jgi:hypothetical protein
VVVTRLIKQQSTGGDASAVEMTREIWREGGAGAFFNGSRERVLYWAPAIGIFLTAYCRIRHAFI